MVSRLWDLMQFDQLKRREFITPLGGAAAWPLAARAQQAKLPTIPWRSFEAVEFATLEWVDWFNNQPWRRDPNQTASGKPGAVHEPGAEQSELAIKDAAQRNAPAVCAAGAKKHRHFLAIEASPSPMDLTTSDKAL
jgi:hypothetical protein